MRENITRFILSSQNGGKSIVGDELLPQGAIEADGVVRRRKSSVRKQCQRDHV